jgi:hypothetical protein
MVGDIHKDTVFENFLESASVDSWRSIESGYYAQYLRGWFQYYKDSIKILFYDDLKHSPLRRLMEELCNWLSISSNCYQDYEFTKENRGIVYKSKKIHLFALGLNIRFERVLRRQQKFKRFVRYLYHQVNEAEEERKREDNLVMQPQTRAYLKEVFAPHNKELFRLLIDSDQKISGWLAEGIKENGSLK